MSDPTLICVVSFPRSGQVWLSRMLADCLGCSLTTRRKRDETTDYAVGKFGQSKAYEIQRSHDSIDEMEIRTQAGDERWPDLIVYLERDPVDVCESVRTWMADGDADRAADLVCGWAEHGTFAGWPTMSEWYPWADRVVQYELLWDNPAKVLSDALRALEIEAVNDPAEVAERHTAERLAEKASQFGGRAANHGAKGGAPGRGYKTLNPLLADRVARCARQLV